MHQEKLNKRIQAYPFQVLEFEGATILRRGIDEIKISGDNAFGIIKIIQSVSENGEKTIEEILELFSGPHRESVSKLIDHLLDRRMLRFYEDEILPPSLSESPQDLFLWHFENFPSLAGPKLNKPGTKATIVLCGINPLIAELIIHYRKQANIDCIVIDDPLLRDPSYFEDDGQLKKEWVTHFGTLEKSEAWKEKNTSSDSYDLLIAGIDGGNFQYLSDWNAFAFRQKTPFFPLLLQNMNGYFGPFVVPGETPCLECLTYRMNSHFIQFEEKSALEKFYKKEGRPLSPAYHSSMLKMLSQTGIFEVDRYLYGIPGVLYGQLGEISLLNTAMKTHKLLKVPRCSVCTPLNKRPALKLRKRLASIEAWTELEKTGSA